MEKENKPKKSRSEAFSKILPRVAIWLIPIAITIAGLLFIETPREDPEAVISAATKTSVYPSPSRNSKDIVVLVTPDKGSRPIYTKRGYDLIFSTDTSRGMNNAKRCFVVRVNGDNRLTKKVCGTGPDNYFDENLIAYKVEFQAIEKGTTYIRVKYIPK